MQTLTRVLHLESTVCQHMLLSLSCLYDSPVLSSNILTQLGQPFHDLNSE